MRFLKYHTPRSYPLHSWIKPCAEARPSPIHGQGIFTKEALKAGEVVIVWGGVLFSPDDLRAGKAVQDSYTLIGEGLYLGHPVEQGPSQDDLMNHSCDPNLWLVDEVTLAARRAIQPGEELTAEYATFLGDDEGWQPTVCYCRTALCRGLITDQDWKLAELQERFSGHFTPFLNRRIEELKLGPTSSRCGI